MKSMEFETTCFDTTLNSELITLMYYFGTEQFSIYSMYSSASESSFNENLSKFREFNDSIQIENTIDLSDPEIMAEIFDLQITKKTISLDESNVELIFSSTGPITQIEFDAASQKLSFLANSEGKLVGSVGISDISELLDSPYEVMISNQQVEFILADDTTTNRQEISMSFSPPSE